MEVILISHEIAAQTPLYGGNAVQITAERCMEHGDTSNSLSLRMTNHASTHVDAPYHFIPHGKKISDYSATDWIFQPVALVDLPAVAEGDLINSSHWEQIDTSALSNDTELILLRTGFEKYRGEETYWARSPGFHPSLCAVMRRRFPRLRALGVDCISISSLLHREVGRAAHKEFLGGDILLVEDMKLSLIRSNPKTVLLSPLLIAAGDAAPVTAFAFLDKGLR